MTHSYLVFRAAECSDATKLKGDPACSSQQEIDKYLKGKVIQFYSTKRIVNFNIEDSYYKETY
jgi:hypothetical protein